MQKTLINVCNKMEDITIVNSHKTQEVAETQERKSRTQETTVLTSEAISINHTKSRTVHNFNFGSHHFKQHQF
jgi:D-tyrosyl-tRNA(Tyr) deacylase